MKAKIIQVLIFVIFLSLILESNLVTSEIKYAIDTFIYILFPSIFPFFLISNLLIEYNFVYTLNRFFSKITIKLFHIGSSSSFVIIMSMISGFPSGSKYIKDLMTRNMLNLNQANYLITFTHFANPLFVLTVTKNIFNNTKIPIYILISMYLSNLIIGFITRPKTIEDTGKLEKIKAPVFSDALSNSIKNSFNLLLMIFGNTCFFFLISRLITHYFYLNSFNKTIINGFLDITKGIECLKILPLKETVKSILVISFISFGGFNIHLQVKNIISNTNIKYINFLLGRVCQIALSSLILLFLIYYNIPG